MSRSGKTGESAGRQPPQDIEAEQQVIATVLQDGRKALDYLGLDVLSPEHFYREHHKAIWRAILALEKQPGLNGSGPKPIDLLTVSDELERTKQVQAAGGLAYVSHLANLPPLEGLRDHVWLVIRAKHQRDQYDVASELARKAFEVVAEPGDLARHYGDLLHDQADEIANLAARWAGKNGKSAASNPYRLLSDEELDSIAPARGILGDLLYEDSIAYLYGPSGCWKTFIASSWGLSIATDVAWLGRSVKHGPVVHVVAEGMHGIAQRRKAWKRHYGVECPVLYFALPRPVDLLDQEAVRQLIASIQSDPRLKGQKPVLIILDTLARCMGGQDENGTAEANKVTMAAYSLKAAFGCCVLILHHSGKDEARGMRGNSALKNNADTIIKVIAPASLAEGTPLKPGDVVRLHCEKSKEVEAFEDMAVTTVREEWYADEDAHEQQPSLVIVSPSEEQVKAQKAQRDRRQVKGSQLVALKALVAAQDGLTSGDWLRASDPLARRTFFTALRVLIQVGAVVLELADKKYRVTDAGREWAE